MLQALDACAGDFAIFQPPQLISLFGNGNTEASSDLLTDMPGTWRKDLRQHQMALELKKKVPVSDRGRHLSDIIEGRALRDLLNYLQAVRGMLEIDSGGHTSGSGVLRHALMEEKPGIEASKGLQSSMSHIMHACLQES